jgi:S-(hydroxymethyl)glutathione dehydrogenase/alcohol dehydrogenase
MGSANPKRDIRVCGPRSTRTPNLDDFVRQEIALKEIEEAYEQLKHGKVIRSEVTEF